MSTLVHVVGHANECFEADCSGWRDVISSAHDLLTHCDLGRFEALCNESYDAMEGGYHLYKNWQFCSLDALLRFGSEMESRVTRKTKRATTWGATMETGVAALIHWWMQILPCISPVDHTL
jgi:hypothetical protein